MKNNRETSLDAETPGGKTTCRLEAIKNVINNMEETLKGSKFTVADYIRLLQFEKELKGEAPPKEVHVQWIERVETPDFEQ